VIWTKGDLKLLRMIVRDDHRLDPLLRYLTTRHESWRLAVLNYGSAAVLTLGVFWFVSRAFG
jgi:hypothetical protein